jgi:hypothetical protein
MLYNHKNKLGKFDVKSYEGIFPGHFSTSKAYRVYNQRTLVVKESIYVVFNQRCWYRSYF